MLTNADGLCPRRLHAEYTGASGSGSPVTRQRLREPFLEAARLVHANGGPPRLEAFRVPASLEPEERRVFEHAAQWYGRWFGSRVVTTYLHDCDHPTPSRRLGVRVGGWVDLTVVAADGGRELRQFDLWGGPTPPEDPLELTSVWVAVLRLARWAADQPLLVSWADLVHGERRERTLRVDEALPDLRGRLEERLDRLRARVRHADQTRPGRDCGSCHHVWRCPAHDDGVNVMARPGDIRPGVITVTPTSLTAWNRCRRWWRNQYLLSVPFSDEPAPSDHGRFLHAILRLLHAHGTCQDPQRVRDLLDGHAAPLPPP